jgi:RNA recognition motif-containing protein
MAHQSFFEGGRAGHDDPSIPSYFNSFVYTPATWTSTPSGSDAGSLSSVDLQPSQSAQPSQAPLAQQAGQAGQAPTPHPNLFVRGIPLGWTEEQLVDLFSMYGELTSLRLVKHSVRKSSLGYGFVRYRNAADATKAINALHGKTMDGHTLQVKQADADAGPPSTSSVSGLTPCDTLYIKHIPLSFSKEHLKQLFGQHGTVVDVKEFPCLDQFRGSSALVKMDSVASAMTAIKHIHGMKPEGWLHNIIVRFAESEKEKKERLARKGQLKVKEGGTTSPPAAPQPEALALHTPASSGDMDVPASAASHEFAKLQDHLHKQLQQKLQQQSLLSMPTPTSGHTMSKVLVRNIPSVVDRLWMFENFARFGAILSLSLDSKTGTAHIYFSELAAGLRAVVEMNQQWGLVVELG